MITRNTSESCWRSFGASISNMKKHLLSSLLLVLAGFSHTLPSLATDDVETYERKVVVEKGTATWCQYCPRSIVGFRTMYEKYPDNFIGIAIHDDDMYSPSYIYLLWSISGGLPKAIMNRKHEIDPNETALENYYQSEINKARARILMTATWEDSAQTKVIVQTTTRFAQDMQGGFRIAYAVTENSVGPYVQTNAYSGAGYQMGGFENEGSYVSMLHDHVARSISNLVGEPGSVPENPKARTDYEYTYTLTLPDNLQNKENIEIIVMLINEQVWISGLSILSGVGIGWAAAQLYVPIIQIAYANSDQMVPLQVVMSAQDNAQLLIIVGIVMAVCLCILGGIVSRMKIAKALKLGED